MLNKSWSHYEECDAIGLNMTINHAARILFQFLDIFYKTTIRLSSQILDFDDNDVDDCNGRYLFLFISKPFVDITM